MGAERLIFLYISLKFSLPCSSRLTNRTVNLSCHFILKFIAVQLNKRGQVHIYPLYLLIKEDLNPHCIFTA